MVVPIYTRPKVMNDQRRYTLGIYLGCCRRMEVVSRDENDVGVPVQLRRLIYWQASMLAYSCGEICHLPSRGLPSFGNNPDPCRSALRL